MMLKQLPGTSVWIERFKAAGKAASLPVSVALIHSHEQGKLPQPCVCPACGTCFQHRAAVIPHFVFHCPAPVRAAFPLIELLVVKTCQIYHSFLVCTGQSREGFGGEKAARESASLPVPNLRQTPHRPIIAPQQSFRSASGEVEQKREEIFPQSQFQKDWLFPVNNSFSHVPSPS